MLAWQHVYDAVVKVLCDTQITFTFKRKRRKIVFKRILTFVLAGILVLETPATAYAAEQGIGIVDTGDMANSNVSDTADGTDNVSDSDGAGSTGNGGDTESTGDTDDTNNTGNSDSAEGDDGTDHTGADHGADSDNGTGDTDNESDDDHGDDIGNGDDGGNVNGSTGENTEPGDSPENDSGTDKDDTDHNDTGNDDIEDNDTENDNIESGNTENDDTEGSDSVSENDISISENDSSVSQNTLYAASEYAATATTDSAITEISYEEATGNGVAVHAPAGRDNAAWYSFTAPRAGRYAFYTDNRDCEGTGTIYVNLCKNANADTKSRTTHFDPGEAVTGIYHYLYVSTDYMKQGETVYLQTYVNGSENRTYTVKAAEQKEIAADENGVRSLELANGDKITLKTQPGCEKIRFEAYADPANKEKYLIRPYWGPADHSTGDLNTDQYYFSSDSTIRLVEDNEESGELTSQKLTSGKTYDISYVVLDNSARFQALLSGMECTTLDRKGEEWLYIHDQACDDHSITIDVEPLSSQGAGNKVIYCYYAPADGSEAEKSVEIDQWKRYEFTGLRSGTEYTFSFRTSTWSEPIKTLTVQTTGIPVEISVSDYEAAISEDFSSLSVSAKTDYAGSGEVLLCFNFKDEIKSYTWRRPITKKEPEGSGFRLYYGYVYVTEMMFLPDKEYEMEIWAEFPDECITMEPQTITFHTPAEAVCSEEDIVLEVTQDSETKSTVHCKVQLPNVVEQQSWYSVYVWYRPLGKPRYSNKAGISYAYATDPVSGNVQRYGADLQILELPTNAEYEFLVYLGGVIKRATINLNESGISLERVENEAADYDGPYDFAHTYRLSDTKGELTGEYYVQLQHIRADRWVGTKGDDQYVNVGYAVSVNDATGYQMMYSAVEQMNDCRVPGVEYNLRWLVGREQKVTKDNAVCCLYENLTMPKASPLKIEEKGYMRYQVTIDEQDVAAMKSHNQAWWIDCYIRKEGATDYVKCPDTLRFNAENNYSVELRTPELASGNSYDIYIGNSSGTKYAEGSFSVSEDQQTLTVDSVEATVSTVKFQYTIQNADPDRIPYIYIYTRKAGSTTWSRSRERGKESGEIRWYDLSEKTEYEYRIGMGGYNATMDELRNLQEGTFTTKAETKKIEVLSVKPGMERAIINCFAGGLKEAGEEDIYRYLVCYYRPVTEGNNKPSWEHGVGVQIQDKTRLECKVTGLTKETDYEYLVGYGTSTYSSVGNLECVTKGTFTTTPDLREVVVTVSPRIYKAAFECAISNVEKSCYLLCYVREDTEAGVWNKRSAKKVSETSSSVSFQTDGLQENTRYQYRVGYGNTDDIAVDALERPSEGDFTTNKDTREVGITMSPKVVSAGLAYTLEGMEYSESAYLCGYIREKTASGAADGENAGDSNGQVTDSWNHKFSEPVDNFSTGGNIRITELRADTDYELTVGFGNGKDCGTDQLIHAKTIEFTTLKDIRKVSGAKADVKEAGVILSAFFEGNIEPQPSYIIFFSKKKEEKKWQKAGYVTNASKLESRECSVTLTGTDRDTEYEFAAVISETNNGVSSPDNVTNPDWKAAGGFTTLPAVAPVTVTLSQEKLYLNAGSAYKNEKGYGYEELKVSWSPDKITKEFVWESSNPDVATVSEDGKVSSVAPGTAQITVASRYNPDANAVCEVVVGSYQIGRPDSAGDIKWQDAETFDAVKGQHYNGYGLYDLSTGTPVGLTDVTVVSDNETVVSWNEGEITAHQVGTAKLVFTASDSVKAYIPVNVQSVPGKGFDIIGFAAGNSRYPAVQEEERDEGRVQYTLACGSGITYTAIGEIVPGTTAFVNTDFIWSIDNEKVAVVSGDGCVTPMAAGKAVLSVTPKDAGVEGGAPYTRQTCEVTLLIKELPSEQLVDATPVYALANICTKIGDVRMPREDAWEGWQWQNPNTPIVINGVNREAYPFRAVYTGEEYYPEEKTINVYIAKVTGMSMYEEADPGHNNVIEVSEVDENGDPAADCDRLTLTVESVHHGRLNPDEETNYFYDVDITAPANVIVQKEEFTTSDYRLYRNFNITAVKPGSYTLTAAIKVKDKNNSHEKVLAKKTYKLKAVAGKQAYVKLVPETTKDVLLDDGRIVIGSDENVAEFNVRAELTDRRNRSVEDFSDVKIAWSVTDKKVIAVKPSKDTRSAVITVKSEGHAILTAKVKDAAGHKDTLQIEIQNNMPRVSTEKVNVNLAYDYDTTAGRNLAKASSGMVEVVPAYDEKVQSITLYESDGETACTDLLMIKETANSVCRLVIRDSKTTVPGTYECVLGVQTNGRDEAYYYPLQVTVKDQQAKVTAKSVRAANLFYRSEPASVDITVPGTGGIEAVSWEDGKEGQSGGFGSEPVEYANYDTVKKAKNVTRFYFRQENIQLTDQNKPADLNAFTGQIKVKVNGYKEPNEGVKVSFKWNYKKPSIVTKAAAVTLIPTMADNNMGRFDLYNNTDRVQLRYAADSTTQNNPKYWYSELSCDNESVKFLPDSSTLGWRRYIYTGSKTKGSEKLKLTIRNADWREPVYAVHTVKLAAPVPYLTSTQLTLNTTQIGTAYTEIGLKKAYAGSLSCDSILVEGGNKKAKALLADDLLEISQDSTQKSRINVKVNRAETMEQAAIANGTYPYKITPCYTDDYGNTVKGKTLNLKIKVTNKAVTAKIKVSGKLDLAKGIGSGNPNYISMKAAFQNIGSGYTLKNNVKLLGDYSNYFDLWLLKNIPGEYRLRIKENGKLKAGQRYKLAIEFTIEMENGDTFTVRSQTFTVTPRQTRPKVKITDNNQTLYAAADTLKRTYGMEVVSAGSYTISSISGSLDCNKDGKPDLQISGLSRQSNSNAVKFTVSITDRDGVMTVTGKKGRTYTMPVVVQLRGRDGIAKDVKTSIKVTVKR